MRNTNRDTDDDKLVICGGENYKIPLSEVHEDWKGRRIHGDHFFPSGNPIEIDTSETSGAESDPDDAV